MPTNSVLNLAEDTNTPVNSIPPPRRLETCSTQVDSLSKSVANLAEDTNTLVNSPPAPEK